MQNVRENKYNILYTSSFGSLRGGGQRSTRLLIKYLNKNNFTPILIVPEEGELSQAIRKLGVKVFIISFPRLRSLNIIAVIKAFFSLYFIIRKEKINLIHTESPRQTAYAGIIVKIVRIPVIMHLRVSESETWLDKILYRLVDSVITVSKTVTNRLSFVKQYKNVPMVYNSVELDTFIPIPTINNGALKIGYFGRIHRGKGIDTLVKAVQQLGNNIALVIMGDGDNEYLKELQHISADANIYFKGYKKDIRNDIAGVDVVVLPSIRGEGLSRIIIEAMAMGKTVVASDQPSNIEALGEEQKEFIFPAGDDKKLAEIIEKIVNNRKILIDNSKICRKRAEQCFDVKKNTKEIEKIYFLLLRNKRA